MGAQHDPIEHGNFKRRDITFPVAVKEASWKSQQPKKLWALNAGDVAKIRAWQPFAAWPDQAELHPLAVLHELWNIDKHRTLHVVATSVELNQILPRIPFPGVPKVEWGTVYERPRAPLVGKELIGRARMIHQPGGMIASTIPQWHMDLDLGIEIVFADGSPGQGRAVIPLLCDLSKTVQTVIAQF